ncbi:MAG: trehalose-phosphatase [Phycisphaeraceae bacterium]|nr:trehalose-phosphatase [Phycisphaeraceae bacterium]
MTGGLQNAIDAAARTPRLLAAFDFDGVLAPIVSDPSLSAAMPEAVASLRTLAAAPMTHVVVISGRARADLERLLPGLEGVELVGSHGAEVVGETGDLTAPERLALEAMTREAEAIAAEFPGAMVECKPYGIAVHYRNVDEAGSLRLKDRVLAGPARRPGVTVRRGKMVVELSLLHATKAHAFEMLRARWGATSTVFVGDDVTDEDVFAVQGEDEVSIKVGPGETRAAHRVGDEVEACAVLARLAAARAAWGALGRAEGE